MRMFEDTQNTDGRSAISAPASPLSALRKTRQRVVSHCKGGSDQLPFPRVNITPILVLIFKELSRLRSVPGVFNRDRTTHLHPRRTVVEIQSYGQIHLANNQ